MERELVTKIISDFGLMLNSNEMPEISLSRLQPNSELEYVRNALVELNAAGIVHVSPQEDRDEIISLSNSYEDKAKRIDYALHFEYDGDVRTMLEEDEEIGEMIDSIEDSLASPDLDPDPVDIEMDLGNEYAVALWPFGNSSLYGSDHNFTDSEIEKVVGKDLSEQLEVLSSAGYLEKNGDRYSLTAEKRVTAENIARCLERDYNFDLDRFWSENEKNFL